MQLLVALNLSMNNHFMLYKSILPSLCGHKQLSAPSFQCPCTWPKREITSFLVTKWDSEVLRYKLIGYSNCRSLSGNNHNLHILTFFWKYIWLKSQNFDFCNFYLCFFVDDVLLLVSGGELHPTSEWLTAKYEAEWVRSLRPSSSAT